MVDLARFRSIKECKPYYDSGEMTHLEVIEVYKRLQREKKTRLQAWIQGVVGNAEEPAVPVDATEDMNERQSEASSFEGVPVRGGTRNTSEEQVHFQNKAVRGVVKARRGSCEAWFRVLKCGGSGKRAPSKSPSIDGHAREQRLKSFWRLAGPGKISMEPRQTT